MFVGTGVTCWIFWACFQSGCSITTCCLFEASAKCITQTDLAGFVWDWRQYQYLGLHHAYCSFKQGWTSLKSLSFLGPTVPSDIYIFLFKSSRSCPRRPRVVAIKYYVFMYCDSRDIDCWLVGPNKTMQLIVLISTVLHRNQKESFAVLQMILSKTWKVHVIHIFYSVTEVRSC